MDAPYQAAPDVHVLPTHIDLPGLGFLPVNAYVLHAEEPVLIDTGLGIDGDQFIDALTSVIDPAKLRWVWLTHDDTGNIQRVLELAPQAPSSCRPSAPCGCRRGGRCRSTGSMPSGWATGSRSGTARCELWRRRCSTTPCRPGCSTRPPGLCSRWTRSAASSPSRPRTRPRCRRTPSPGACSAGPRRTRRGPTSPTGSSSAKCSTGSGSWQPNHILSSHLPAASGTSLENFLQVLAMVPDAEPAVAPSHEEFGYMLAAMTAGSPPQQPAAAPYG